MCDIRDRFIRDMQAGGLSASTQERYLKNVEQFFKRVWRSPEAVTETQVQAFMIGLRERDVARETFRNYFFALKFFFGTTLRRDWASLKKTGFVRPPSSVFASR